MNSSNQFASRQVASSSSADARTVRDLRVNTHRRSARIGATSTNSPLSGSSSGSGGSSGAYVPLSPASERRAAELHARREISIVYQPTYQLRMRDTQVDQLWRPIPKLRWTGCATDWVPAKAGRGIHGKILLVVEFRPVQFEQAVEVEYRHRPGQEYDNALGPALKVPPIPNYTTPNCIAVEDRAGLQWDPLYIAPSCRVYAANLYASGPLNAESRKILMVAQWHAEYDRLWPDVSSDNEEAPVDPR